MGMPQWRRESHQFCQLYSLAWRKRNNILCFKKTIKKQAIEIKPNKVMSFIYHMRKSLFSNKKRRVLFHHNCGRGGGRDQNHLQFAVWKNGVNCQQFLVPNVWSLKVCWLWLVEFGCVSRYFFMFFFCRWFLPFLGTWLSISKRYESRAQLPPFKVCPSVSPSSRWIALAPAGGHQNCSVAMARNFNNPFDQYFQPLHYH